jgi:hypothetical protein
MPKAGKLKAFRKPHGIASRKLFILRVRSWCFVPFRNHVFAEHPELTVGGEHDGWGWVPRTTSDPETAF